jgi:predicted DNA-binding transcriptional regulator AlpA
MSLPREPIVQVLADLAAVGRRLVATSESALALLAKDEAECRSDEPTAMPAPPTETALLTGREVVALLKVSDRTFRRLRASGQGPQPVKVGGAMRWRREAVLRWLARRQD